MRFNCIMLFFEEEITFMIIKLLSKRQSSNEKEQFNAKNLPSIHDYKNLMFFTLYVARIMPIYWECFCI